MSHTMSKPPTAKQSIHELTHVITFFKERKLFVLLSLLIITTTYWAKIIYPNYSIDTEEFMIYGKRNGFIQWLAIGRYGLFLMKQTIMGYTIHIRLINVATYFILFLSVVLLGYIFFRVANSLTNTELLILPILFSTSAILLEQFNFILQSVEVSLSYFLVFLSVYLCYLASHDKKRLYYGAGSLLAIISFSVYPSNYLAFIVFSIMIIMILIAVNSNSLSLKQYFVYLIPYMSQFIISAALNKALLTFFLYYYKIPRGHYVESSILWGKISPKEVIAQMIAAIKSLYLFPNNLCFSYATTLGLFLMFFIILTRPNNKLWLFLSASALVIASNANIIVLGQLGPFRSMAPMIPLLTAFLFLFTFHHVTFHYAKVILFLIVLLFGAIQLKRTNQFAIQEEVIFREETTYVNKIVTELEKKGIKELENYQLAAIGSKHFPERGAYYQGDALGASFFNWDNTSPVGSSGRIHSFFNSLGYPIQRIDEEHYQQIIEYEKEHPMTPDTIAVTGSTIILKLND